MSIFEDLFRFTSGGAVEQAEKICEATVTRELADTDNDIKDVEDNWKPTGFYNPDQMKRILAFGMDVRSKAQALITAGISASQLPSHRERLTTAHEELNEDQRIDPMPFINGMNAAINQGIKVIEAPGFKRWVLYTLKAARAAKKAALFVDCARPKVLFGAIEGLNRAAEALVELVKTIGDAIVTAGETILKIPDLLSSVLSFIKILPWFVLVGGGYYLGVKMGWIPAKYDPAGLRNRDPFSRFRSKQKQLPAGD